MGRNTVVPQIESARYITVYDNQVVPVATKDIQLSRLNAIPSSSYSQVKPGEIAHNNNMHPARNPISIFKELPSTSIHPNSILNTPNMKRHPPFQRSSSVDSATEAKEETDRLNTKSFSVSRMFKSSHNLVNEKDVNCKQKGKSEISKLYHRWSGSVHSLFQSRPLSASDTNLSVRKKTNNVLSQQQLIDQDYCPSVIYNRKQRQSQGTTEKTAEKTLTFNRIKNNLFQRFARKPNNINSRKT